MTQTETAAPPVESIGRVWLRGFAAGSWALAGFGIVASLLLDLLVRIPVTGAALLPAIPQIILLFRLSLCLIVPLAVARGMVAEGRGLPPWTLPAAAVGAFCGGLGWLVVIWGLAVILAALQTSAIDDVAALLGLITVAAAALGTPVLAQGLWPRLEGLAWSGVLAIAALGAAELLYWRLGAWLYQVGTDVLLTWLGMSSLVWGSALGALPVLMAARRAAARAAVAPRRVWPLLLAAGALGLLLLGLMPFGTWVLLALASTLTTTGGLPALPPPPPAPAPAPYYVPGRLPIAAPQLLTPPAGAALSGPVWSFGWRPPAGAQRADQYQFTLWAPRTTLPVMELVTPPGPGLRMSSHVPLLPAANRVGPGAKGAPLPPGGRWPSGPWTWRIRLVRPGQGAGQWSEARPFTPIWGGAPGAARR